ncbi:hypothetical protein [Scytonema sp. NUACC26]
MASCCCDRVAQAVTVSPLRENFHIGFYRDRAHPSFQIWLNIDL